MSCLFQSQIANKGENCAINYGRPPVVCLKLPYFFNQICSPRKSGTITTLEDAHNFTDMKYSVSPVVKVAVKPKVTWSNI